MSQLFKNNASGTLSVQLDPGAGNTTVILQTGEATLFPAPTGTDFAMATIENVDGDIEIVKINPGGNDGSQTLTVTRAQENTSAILFVVGSRVELRVTAGTFDEFVQRTGSTMTGELNMNSEILRNPLILGGEARALTLRGTDGGTANQLIVPTAGGAPTIGGQSIYTPTTLAAGQRIDHTAVTITAGSGLSYSTGGTDISASATIDVDLSGLTAMEGNLLAGTDTFLVNDGGVNKAVEVQDMGMRIKTGRSTTDTLAASDMNAIIKYTATSTLTLPLNTGTPLPIGVPIVLNTQGTGVTLTVTAAASVILVSVFHSNGDTAASDTVKAGGTALLYKTATNTWVLTGDIST